MSKGIIRCKVKALKTKTNPYQIAPAVMSLDRYSDEDNDETLVPRSRPSVHRRKCSGNCQLNTMCKVGLVLCLAVITVLALKLNDLKSSCETQPRELTWHEALIKDLEGCPTLTKVLVLANGIGLSLIAYNTLKKLIPLP